MDEKRTIAQVLELMLRSNSEAASGGESANVVDGLIAIARAIERLADVMDQTRYVTSSVTIEDGAEITVINKE